MSKTQVEKILIANDLLTGEVLFMGKDGWVLDNADAQIATSPEDQVSLNAQGVAGMASNLVVDAYLVDIKRDADGVPQPLHYRELMRTKGPSNRLDLGKQAELGNQTEAHV